MLPASPACGLDYVRFWIILGMWTICILNYSAFGLLGVGTTEGLDYFCFGLLGVWTAWGLDNLVLSYLGLGLVRFWAA
jgi:hypothetical protein